MNHYMAYKQLLDKHKDLFARSLTKDNNRNPFYMFRIECALGWHDLIDKLLTDIKEYCDKAGRKYPVFFQIKEKYAGLRVYIDSGDDTIYELIKKAEEISTTTCELCGKKGKTRNIGNWLNTFCNKCYKSMGGKK